MIDLNRIDHLVITVKSIEVTCEWYHRVLNTEISVFADNRKALLFGTSKINLHESGREFEPRAVNAGCGTGDFCLIANTPLDEVIAHFKNENVAIELGPVEKTGATGELLSIYIRDPDNNLVEISNYR